MSDEFNNDYYNQNNNAEGENGDSNNIQNNNENTTGDNNAYSLNNNSESQNQNPQQGTIEPQNNYPQNNYSAQNNYNSNYSNPNNGYYNYNNQSPYQNNNYNNGSNDNKNHKKSWSFGKKLAVVTLVAVLVGVSVGGALLGSSLIYNPNNTTSTVAESQNATDSAQSETQLANQLSVADTDTNNNSQAVVLDVSDVVTEALPSVVSVTNSIVYSGTIMGQQYQQEGEANGSGVIISKSDTELLIVTNNHVIATDTTGASYYYTLTSNGIKVTFADDTTVEANLKGTDATVDLAVIAVPLANISQDTLNSVKVATVGNSDDMKVGQAVIAIGNALGYGQSTTFGIVSALNREVAFTDSSSSNSGNLFGGQGQQQEQETKEEVSTQKLLQTDAAINPGNSGGGLFNMAGQLIGINAAKYSDTDVEGMGYAIPITEASDIITGLMNQETKVTYNQNEQGYLGIKGTTVTSSMQQYSFPTGVYVDSVSENIAAANAGIKQYDVITKVNDTTVTTMEGLKKELSYYKSGETVNITLKRMEGNWNEMTVPVTLASYAEASAASDSTTAADENANSNQNVNPFPSR